MDAKGVVALGVAAQERYGFKDFMLKGGVLHSEDEMEAIVALSERFPDSRITLELNGGWLLKDIIRICRGRHKELADAKDLRGAEGVFSGREVMANSAKPPACSPQAIWWRTTGAKWPARFCYRRLIYVGRPALLDRAGHGSGDPAVPDLGLAFQPLL